MTSCSLLTGYQQANGLHAAAVVGCVGLGIVLSREPARSRLQAAAGSRWARPAVALAMVAAYLGPLATSIAQGVWHVYFPEPCQRSIGGCCPGPLAFPYLSAMLAANCLMLAYAACRISLRTFNGETLLEPLTKSLLLYWSGAVFQVALLAYILNERSKPFDFRNAQF